MLKDLEGKEDEWFHKKFDFEMVKFWFIKNMDEMWVKSEKDI